MPIFEYKCKKCGEEFEFLARGKEKAVCPKCGAKTLKKLISGFSAKVSANSTLAKLNTHQMGTCCGGAQSCCESGRCCCQ